MNYSPHDRWKLGLDEPDEEFCTPRQLAAMRGLSDKLYDVDAANLPDDVRELYDKLFELNDVFIDVATEG